MFFPPVFVVGFLLFRRVFSSSIIIKNSGGDMSDHSCTKCSSCFESRNKLFKHIKLCGKVFADTDLNQSKKSKLDTSINLVKESDQYKNSFLFVFGGRDRGKTLRTVERYSYERLV